MPQKIGVTGLDEKGRGIAGELHVQFAYPGDVIEVELLNRRKKTGRLQIAMILSRETATNEAGTNIARNMVV